MKKIAIFSLIGIFLLIALKSCIVTPFSIDDYILLESSDEVGQFDRIFLTPKEEMIFIKNFQDITEVGIYKINGLKATHYISGLYCVGTFPFGLRYYNNAENVFDTELKLLKKHGESFPKLGNTYRTKIIIYKDKAEIGKHSYKRISLNQEEKESAESMINQLKYNIN